MRHLLTKPFRQWRDIVTLLRWRTTRGLQCPWCEEPRATREHIKNELKRRGTW